MRALRRSGDVDDSDDVDDNGDGDDSYDVDGNCSDDNAGDDYINNDSDGNFQGQGQVWDFHRHGQEHKTRNLCNTYNAIVFRNICTIKV